MHTTSGVTPGVSFHYNGDFSGNVHISVNSDTPGVRFEESDPAGEFPGSITLELPFADLKYLVASYCRSRRIEALEDCDDDAVLGLAGWTRGPV